MSKTLGHDNERAGSHHSMRDYLEFISTEQEAPPPGVSQQIFHWVSARLNPSPWSVFGKMTIAHFILGMAVLLICPHFGIHLFDSKTHVIGFIEYGEVVCMMGCGALFLGLSSLIFGFLVREEEFKIIRNNRLLQLSIFAIISLGTFISLGTSTELSLGIGWTFGALLAGFGALEFGHALKTFILTGKFKSAPF